LVVLVREPCDEAMDPNGWPEAPEVGGGGGGKKAKLPKLRPRLGSIENALRRD